jgi:hypothetical protein
MRPTIFVIIAALLVGCASSETHTHRAISPLIQYDDDFRSSIQKNWEALLHGKNRAGKIVLEFHLTFDGHITDMKVIQDSVGNGQALICEKAVLAPIPYPPWPADMVHMVGANYRVCTFTFNY